MKNKTKEVRLWDYLSKKLSNPKLAKEVYHYVVRELGSKTREINIKYSVDTKALRESIQLAKQLNAELSKAFRK